MKNLRNWIIAFILMLTIILLLVIWIGLPVWLDEINPMVTPTSLSLLSTIVFLLAGGFIGHFYKRPNNVEKENTTVLKETLATQKKMRKADIRQTLRYLWTTFKLITQNRVGYFRHLPCYLAINSKDSKSQAFFDKCGLDFIPSPHPSAERGLKEIIGLSCQWRISDQAILLALESDITEDFWGVQSESSQWVGVLKFLKQFRRFRTLNGIMISLSLPELVIQSESSLNERLKSLKALIQSLYQKFKFNIPVYIIFTQTDTITGFPEFFSNLTLEQRNQLWGIAFPKEGLLHAPQCIEYFEKEFDKLISTLNALLFSRLESERETEKRAMISCFPEQMYLCKPALKQFLTHTADFFVRGMYFSGNSETDKTYDFALSSLAARIGLTLQKRYYVVGRGDYFSRKIFPEAILKEVDILERNSYFQGIKTIHRRTRWLIAGGIFVTATTGFSISYAHNINTLDAMTQILPLYRQASMTLSSTTDSSLLTPLESLNILQQMRSYFEDSAYFLRVYGLVLEPIVIQKQLNGAWQKLLSTQFMPRVFIQLQSIMQNNPDNAEWLYEALKAYLVFGPVAQNHPEWIKPPIQFYINKTYVNAPESQLQLNHYLAAALIYPVDSLPLNEELIEKTRVYLKQIPPALFAYHELKTQSELSRSQFKLDQKINANFNSVFTYQDELKTSLSLLFTLEGFLKLHGHNTKNLILHTADVYQILGLSNQDNAPELATEMNPAVWELYNKDYMNAWQEYLDNIHVQPFNNINNAVQILNNILRPHNPLNQILRVVSENTAPVHAKNMTVAEHFSALNAFTGLPKKPGVQYQILIKNLTALRDYLNGLSVAPDASKVEFEDASAYMQNKAPGNPIAVLKQQARQLPTPVNQWVNEIADNSFDLLLQGAKQVINAAWQSAVFPIYNANIQGRFPFSQQTDAYVNLTNFGEFFGNSGVYSQFFQTYLASFINTNHSPWAQYQAGGHTLGLSQTTLVALEQADKIRAMYFANNDKTPAVNFSLQARVLDLQSSSVYLQLAGQNLSYRHGPQQLYTWHWPAAGDTQQVSLAFNDFSGKTSSNTLEGPWAWFSLMNATHIESTGAPGHYIWTIHQDAHEASFDIWTANNLPVFSLAFLQQFHLPESL